MLLDLKKGGLKVLRNLRNERSLVLVMLDFMNKVKFDKRTIVHD